DDVFPLGDHRAPPLFLDVLLELNAQRSVVPGRAGTAVDLSRGEDESTAFAQTDDVVESTGRGHERFSRRLAVPSPAGMESSALGYRPQRRRLGRGAIAGRPGLQPGRAFARPTF